MTFKSSKDTLIWVWQSDGDFLYIKKFDKLSKLFQGYTDAEKAYSRTCSTGYGHLQYYTESEMNDYYDLLTVPVQQVLNEEIGNIE